jgi:hypothetical protein
MTSATYSAPLIRARGSLVTRTLSSLTSKTTQEAGVSANTNAQDVTDPNSTL